MNKKEIPRLEIFLRALAHEHRLRIVFLLVEKNHRRFQELKDELPVSQPALSHHIGKLLHAGIIRQERRGRECLYVLDRGTCGKMFGHLKAFTAQAKQRTSPAVPSAEQKTPTFWSILFPGS